MKKKKKKIGQLADSATESELHSPAFGTLGTRSGWHTWKISAAWVVISCRERSRFSGKQFVKNVRGILTLLVFMYLCFFVIIKKNGWAEWKTRIELFPSNNMLFLRSHLLLDSTVECRVGGCEGDDKFLLS